MEYDEEKDAMRELLTHAALDLLSSETLIAKLEAKLEEALIPPPIPAPEVDVRVLAPSSVLAAKLRKSDGPNR